MIVFLSIHAPQPWLEVVSISGALGDGFVRQTTGTISRSSTAALDALEHAGLVETTDPARLQYRLTARGMALVSDSLRSGAAPVAHQHGLPL